MPNDSFVTHEECEDYRSEFKQELNGYSARLIRMETCFSSMISILKMIFVAVLGGFVSVVVTLIVR